MIIAELKAGWPSAQTQQSVIDMTISATVAQYIQYALVQKSI